MIRPGLVHLAQPQGHDGSPHVVGGERELASERREEPAVVAELARDRLERLERLAVARVHESRGLEGARGALGVREAVGAQLARAPEHPGRSLLVVDEARERLGRLGELFPLAQFFRDAREGREGVGVLGLELARLAGGARGGLEPRLASLGLAALLGERLLERGDLDEEREAALDAFLERELAPESVAQRCARPLLSLGDEGAQAPGQAAHGVLVVGTLGEDRLVALGARRRLVQLLFEEVGKLAASGRAVLGRGRQLGQLLERHGEIARPPVVAEHLGQAAERAHRALLERERLLVRARGALGIRRASRGEGARSRTAATRVARDRPWPGLELVGARDGLPRLARGEERREGASRGHALVVEVERLLEGGLGLLQPLELAQDEPALEEDGRRSAGGAVPRARTRTVSTCARSSRRFSRR